MRRKAFVAICVVMTLLNTCGCFEGLAARGRVIDVRRNFEIQLFEGRVREYGGGLKPIKVTVSPYGHFSTAYCTEVTYALRNNKTHEIMPIYDWKETYEEAERERANRRLSMLPFFIAFPVATYLLLSWGRKNTISAREQARRQQMQREYSGDNSGGE